MHKKISSLFIVIVILSACNNPFSTPSTSTPISIISLEQNIGQLQEKANEWDPDAYLVSVDIPISVNGEIVQSWLISAVFQSTSKEQESVIIHLYPDDKFEVISVDHKKPINHVHPLTQQEWQIDSQEALNLLLDEDRTRLLKQTQKNCSDLSLEHRDPRENSVIWILTIFDCGPDMSGKHYYLDPNTGEVDEFSR